MLVEDFKNVQALYPQVNTGALVGAYISLKTAHMCWVKLGIQQGNAAVIAVTIEQATAIAGTGSTPITVAVPIWWNIDTSLTDALVRQPAAVGFTTDAGVKNKELWFEIDPATLNIAGGFDCLTVKCAASNAANLVYAEYFLADRYSQATPPSARVD
jgi:hypothetical protein